MKRIGQNLAKEIYKKAIDMKKQKILNIDITNSKGNIYKKTYIIIEKGDILLVSVGDENHEPTTEEMDRAINNLETALKKNTPYIVPYYVKFQVLKIR